MASSADEGPWMPTEEMLVGRGAETLARIIIEQVRVVRRLRGQNFDLQCEIDNLKRVRNAAK